MSGFVLLLLALDYPTVLNWAHATKRERQSTHPYRSSGTTSFNARASAACMIRDKLSYVW